MLRLTKIFYFEMAHAISGYSGSCRNIHGHSYELYVTVTSANDSDEYIPAPGFEVDFKEIKNLVTKEIIHSLDHKLLLSGAYLAKNPGLCSQENLISWDAEPTAENLLIYIRQILENKLPKSIMLAKLKLYETKDSYAEWIKS